MGVGEQRRAFHLWTRLPSVGPSWHKTVEPDWKTEKPPQALGNFVPGRLPTSGDGSSLVPPEIPVSCPLKFYSSKPFLASHRPPQIQAGETVEQMGKQARRSLPRGRARLSLGLSFHRKPSKDSLSCSGMACPLCQATQEGLLRGRRRGCGLATDSHDTNTSAVILLFIILLQWYNVKRLPVAKQLFSTPVCQAPF